MNPTEPMPGGDAATPQSFKGGGANLQPGQLVGAGRFRLVNVLGQGGGGFVWRSQDEVLGEEVALKFLPRQVRKDPRAFAGLREEVSNSRRLAHPNIVRIFNLEMHGDEEPFISMELVRGKNMNEIMAAKTQYVFSWDYLRSLVEQLCSALSYAHQERVIHRDLKPANLMLDDADALKLADFGISRQMSDTATRAEVRGQISGTLLYMSPQQLEGKSARPADDVYSFGATLYELLSGTPPFYSGEILHQILTLEAEPLQQRLAERGIANPVPLAVRETVARCLAKNPADRPRNMDEVLIGLGLWGAGRVRPFARAPQDVAGPSRASGASPSPEVARPRIAENPAWEQELPPPKSRNRWFSLVSGLALVALGAAAWAYFLRPEWVREQVDAVLARLTATEQVRATNAPPAIPNASSTTNAALIAATGTAAAVNAPPSIPQTEIEKPAAPEPDAQVTFTSASYKPMFELRRVADGQLARSGGPSQPIRIPAGRYRILGESQGWSVPFTEEIELGSGQAISMPVAIVRLDSRPSGATVTHGGTNRLGTTPLRIPVRLFDSRVFTLERTAYHTTNFSTGTIVREDLQFQVDLIRVWHPTSGPYRNSLGLTFHPVMPNVWFCEVETRKMDFRQFVGAWPKYRQSHQILSSYEKPSDSWSTSVRHPSERTSERVSEEDPVAHVTWHDAVKFGEWLTSFEQENRLLDSTWEYRLPSDLEWSQAAGITGESGVSPRERFEQDAQFFDVFPWGAGFPPPKGFANYYQTNHDSFPTIAPVFTLAANAFGLRHMAGNVSEWCLDEYGGAAAGGTSRRANRGRNAPPVERTVRGGSFHSQGRNEMRANYRQPLTETDQRENVGFRLVLAPRR